MSLPPSSVKCKGAKHVYMFTDQAYDVWGWDTSDMAGYEQWRRRGMNDGYRHATSTKCSPYLGTERWYVFNEMSQSHRVPASPIQAYEDPYFYQWRNTSPHFWYRRCINRSFTWHSQRKNRERRDLLFVREMHGAKLRHILLLQNKDKHWQSVRTTCFDT